MDRGIYTATSAGLIAERQMQIVSNNLANTSTAGYKGQRIITKQQEFADTLASTLLNAPTRAKSDQDNTPGVVDVSSITDFAPGPIGTTGDPLNVALTAPNQFFVVQTPQGEAYTRAGNFKINAEGQLITPDGMPVVGDGGPISVSTGKATIANTATLSVDGKPIGKLRVVEFDDPQKLERTGGVRFKATGGAQARQVENPQVVTESLEMPNVNVVGSMVEMINASKGFEAYTKTIKTIDDLNTTATRSARSNG